MVRIGVISIVFVSTLGVAACGGGGGTQTATGAVTFWQDVAPIYNSKCVRCHQEGGIVPWSPPCPGSVLPAALVLACTLVLLLQLLIGVAWG
jgi:hypothetical protein